MKSTIFKSKPYALMLQTVVKFPFSTFTNETSKVCPSKFITITFFSLESCSNFRPNTAAICY